MPKDRAKQTKSPVCPYPAVGTHPRTAGWTVEDDPGSQEDTGSDPDKTIQSTDGEIESVSMAPRSESPPGGGCRDNETNLIVNYLPSSMTQDDIRSLFCSLGELESCKLIRDKLSGQSLGYGFVKYKRPGDARKAISALNGLRLQNKTIKVSLARPSSDTIKGANLYISGLSKTMTSHDLHKIFSSFGDIITARVLCDTQTGFSKGVGFIRYNLKSQAESAIRALNGSVPSGSREPITVKFANQPTVNKPVVIFPQTLTTAICPQSGQIIASYPTVSPASNINRICYPPPPSAPPPPTDPPQALPLSAATPSASSAVGCSLYVNNLPPDVDDASLWRLFCPFGSVHGVRVIRHLATNKCKGSALVTMSSYDEAMLAAASLTGHQVDGQPIQVSIILHKAPPTPCVATPTHCVAPPTHCVAPSSAAGFLPGTHHPAAGYGLLSGTGLVGHTDGSGGAIEVVRLGGGLQFVGYQGYQGLPPGAVAMATVGGDYGGGLTALPIM